MFVLNKLSESESESEFFKISPYFNCHISKFVPTWNSASKSRHFNEERQSYVTRLIPLK